MCTTALILLCITRTPRGCPYQMSWCVFQRPSWTCVIAALVLDSPQSSHSQIEGNDTVARNYVNDVHMVRTGACNIWRVVLCTAGWRKLNKISRYCRVALCYIYSHRAFFILWLILSQMLCALGRRFIDVMVRRHFLIRSLICKYLAYRNVISGRLIIVCLAKKSTWWLLFF